MAKKIVLKNKGSKSSKSKKEEVKIVKPQELKYIRFEGKMYSYNEYRILDHNDRNKYHPQVIGKDLHNWMRNGLGEKYQFECTSPIKAWRNDDEQSLMEFESMNEESNLMISYYKKKYARDKVNYDDKYTVFSPMFEYYEIYYTLARYDDEEEEYIDLGYKFTEQEMLSHLMFLARKNAMWLDRSEEDEPDPNAKEEKSKPKSNSKVVGSKTANAPKAKETVSKKIEEKKVASKLIIKKVEQKSEPKKEEKQTLTLGVIAKKFGFKKDKVGDLTKDNWAIEVGDDGFYYVWQLDDEDDFNQIKKTKKLEVVLSVFEEVDENDEWDELYE